MLFATASLARRIEQAESSIASAFWSAVARRVRDGSLYRQEIGGGSATVAGPASPLSKIVGVGFEPLSEDALGAIEQEFARRKTAVRVEVSTLADSEVGAMLSRRGYVLMGFENVLALEPGRDHAAGVHRSSRTRAGSPIAVTRTPEEDAAKWSQVVTTGFSHPDHFDGPPSLDVVDQAAIDQIFRDLGNVEGLIRYLATLDGEVAGGASMRIWKGVAQLCGAATLPQHRRRGVQTSLLRQRLADAAREGCDVAVVTTQPGSPSQENAQRQGFELLYSRAILVKPAA